MENLEKILSKIKDRELILTANDIISGSIPSSIKELNLDFLIGKIDSLKLEKISIGKLFTLNSEGIDFDIFINGVSFGEIFIENKTFSKYFEINRSNIEKDIFFKKNKCESEFNIFNTSFGNIILNNCDFKKESSFTKNIGKEFIIIDTLISKNIDFNSSILKKLFFISLNPTDRLLLNLNSTEIEHLFLNLKNDKDFDKIIFGLFLSNIKKHSGLIKIDINNLGSFVLDDLEKYYSFSKYISRDSFQKDEVGNFIL